MKWKTRLSDLFLCACVGFVTPTRSQPQHTPFPTPSLRQGLSDCQTTATQQNAELLVPLPSASPRGPQLKIWRVENGTINSAAMASGVGRRQTERASAAQPWRLYLRLHSASALRKILLYDGNRLFRYYSPTSVEKVDFSRVLTGAHDRQHRFVVEAEDQRGGRLVSSALYTKDMRFQLTASEDGTVLRFGSVQQEKDGHQVQFGAGRLEADAVGLALGTTVPLPHAAGEEDYLAGNLPGSVAHLLDTVQGEESARPRYRFLFGSRDCLLVEGDYTRLLENGDPTRLADTVARYYYFPSRLHGPSLVLIERETVLKQTIEGSDSHAPNLQMLSVGVDSAATNFAFVQPEGRVVLGDQPGKANSAADVMVKTGGYATVFPDPDKIKTSDLGPTTSESNISQTAISHAGGSVCVFPLRSELQMAGVWQPLLLHVRIQQAMLTFGYHLPIQVLPMETRFRQTFLLLRPPPTDFSKEPFLKQPVRDPKAIETNPAETKSNKSKANESHTAYFTEIQQAFGLDGSAPAYQASTELGSIASGRYPLDVGAEDSAVLIDFIRTNLPCGLPIRISGLQENWTAVCLELPINTKSVPVAPDKLARRGFGVQDNTGYFSLDLYERAHRLFLGHPVVCDRPDIQINVLDWEPQGLRVELHNPGKETIMTQVRIHRLLGFGKQTVRIPARSSVFVTLTWK